MNIEQLNEQIRKVLNEDYSDIKPNTKQFDIVDKDGCLIDTLYVTPLEDGNFDYWTDTFDSISQATNLNDIIDDVKDLHNTGIGAEAIEIVGLNEEMDTDIERKQLTLETNFDNGVSVSSDEAATNFVNLKFLELKDEKTAIENFKELLKLCRENKIPVKGRAKVKAILALYPEYKKSVEEYNKVVAELQDDWKKIVEEGIFTGFGDDERINKAHEKRFKIEHLLYGTGALSKYNSMTNNIQKKLDDLKYDIAHPGEFGKTIWIGF